jgi:hypothetical protein
LNALADAARLLRATEGVTEPGEKVRNLKAGLDLLDTYAQDTPALGGKDRQRLRDLRTSYARELLASLSDARGGSAELWLEHVRLLLLKMKPEVDAIVERHSRNASLIPQPDDGAVVEISPPGLVWLPLERAASYRIELRSSRGALLYQGNVGSDPMHLPDQVLPSGAYVWDVVALDALGNECTRRGEQRFTIAAGVPELPYVEPRALLERVPKDHPRLLYTKQDLPSLRATLENTRRRSWTVCRAAAERALAVPPPKYPSYHLVEDRVRSRLACSQYCEDLGRAVDGALVDLSLAYLMTGEHKYAEGAKRILLALADWPTDDNDVTSVSSRWGDEPGLSIARCVPRAYDWLYHALGPEERARVQAMCEARAWQAYRHLRIRNYLTCPGESHSGRLIAYLAEMAIALAGESEGAEEWLDYSLKALTTFYPHWGGADGGWAEGTVYGLWYTRFALPAIEALRQALGLDLWKRPFFRKSRYFFFYCTALRGEMSPFGDGAETSGPGTDGGSGYAQLLWYHAHRFDDPYIGWWVTQVGGWENSGGGLSLLFPDAVRVKQPDDLPNSRVFHNVGWAALHSDLSHPDEDTFLLFKSSPFGSASHSHADQNAFCIMKGGQALAIPSGYYWPGAGMPHHSRWTSTTKANNCVLVNGKGQATQDRRARGQIRAFEDRKGWSYVVGDAAAAYMGRVRCFDRHILFLRPGLILLLDILETPQPAQFQWMLHAFERMEVNGQARQVVSRRRGAVLEVWLGASVGLNLSQTDRFDTPCNAGVPEDYTRDLTNHWHVTAETSQRADRVRIGAIMAARGPGESLDLALFERDGWFGARATGPFGSVEGWVQLQPDMAGPRGYGRTVAEGKAIICGTSVDGARSVH